MPKRPLTNLAINPGTRYLGIAVLEGAELLDWGVKVINGSWSPEKLKRITTIIVGLIEQWQPSTLAVKRLHPARSSSRLLRLLAEITKLSSRHHLSLRQYSIADLEAFFCLDERLNKKHLVQAVVSRYPELLPEFQHDERSRNPYHLRMFEAVALATICFHQFNKY